MTSHRGLNCILSMAIVITFNTTLSGVAKPYEGVYYKSDRRCFKNIFNTISTYGYIENYDLNLAEPYTDVVQRFAGRGVSVKKNNRYTCAGLAEFLVHVARALVQLSYFWETNGERPQGEDEVVDGYETDEEYVSDNSEEEKDLDEGEKEKLWLGSDKVRSRAITDLGKALGLPRKVASALVGTVHECASMPGKTLTPASQWIDSSSKKGGPPSLWDAFYSMQRQAADEDDQMADDEDEGGEGEEDEDEE